MLIKVNFLDYKLKNFLKFVLKNKVKDTKKVSSHSSKNILLTNFNRTSTT